MKLTETIQNETELEARLITLSQEYGGAWVFVIRPFSHSVQFIRFENPSRVPDRYHDLTQNTIAYKGELRGFTRAAIIREQNRGLGRA